MTPAWSGVLIATGGALGALSRWYVALWVASFWQGSFPLATFLINLAGSVAFGLVFVWAEMHPLLRDGAKLFLLTGFMGAFTTFSTFSFETFRLMEYGKFGLALANILVSVMLCVAGAALGYLAGRQIFQ